MGEDLAHVMKQARYLLVVNWLELVGENEQFVGSWFQTSLELIVLNHCKSSSIKGSLVIVLIIMSMISQLS